MISTVRAIRLARAIVVANMTQTAAPQPTRTNGTCRKFAISNDNYIKYTYTRDTNEVYPSQIIYTGNGANDGPAVISFATSTRPDTRISFAPGFKVTTNYRISEIDTSFNSKLLRKYLLSYSSGMNGVRSLLTSVQQQGYDDNSNLVSLPATSFTYASSTGQFYTLNGVTSAAFQVADTNGNGINDRNEFYSPGCVNGVCTTGLHIYMDSTTYVITTTILNRRLGFGPPPQVILRVNMARVMSI